MPTIINELIEKFDLEKSNMVKWNEKIPTEEEGVYIVSLSDDPNFNKGICKVAPISEDIISKWIEKVNGFNLDKKLTYNADLIIKRLSLFWLPDENIIYIGKAPVRKYKKGIGNRVNEFYKTNYGYKKPHAGGHWLKSLSIINNLYVYYVICDNSGEIELKFLQHFMENVSDETKKYLKDKALILPFGNLEFKKGQIKNHGLGKMN